MANRRKVVDAQSERKPVVSIVIPVYNRASLTRQCLHALQSTLSPESRCEVIVVDDGSTDLTRDLLVGHADSIRAITHAENAGFATACNDGASAAVGDYLIFLNNDTIPRAGWLEALLAYIDLHHRAAAVGAKLLFPNGTIQHAGVAICQDRYPRHIYVGFPGEHPAVNQSRRFQAVTAGCMLVRRETFKAVGGFDPAFINGFEDVDFCLRLGAQGQEIHYCHESELYHFESVSEGRFTHVEHNTELYRRRWRDHVVPDDLRYYVEDGLLSVSYKGRYPLRIAASPLLAAVSGEQKTETEVVDRLLDWRSRQVQELLSENLRLYVMSTESRSGDSITSLESMPYPSLQSSPGAVNSPSILSSGHPPARGRLSSDHLVSVIVPTKNGADLLRKHLPRILEQRGVNIEIIAVDSGSRDGTVDLLRHHGATVVSIDPRSFNHGLTRNLGASYARGRLLVFVNQSTMPADQYWLANLISPLDRDLELAGACSRVLPHEDADVLTRRDGLRDPSAAAERRRVAITGNLDYAALSHHQLRVFINFHTVSAAIRPQVLERIPFREVRMGEDVFWAKDVMEAGYAIQHEPSSVVFHSHRYSYLEILQRNVDDGMVNREIVGRTIAQTELVPMIEAMVHDDWGYLEQECRMPDQELDNWRLTSTLRRVSQIVGQYIGVNHDTLPSDLMSLLSLTERIKVEGLNYDAGTVTA